MSNNIVTEEMVKNYFAGGTRKVVRVIPNDDYTLTLEFDNNVIKIYDMSNELTGVFSFLKNLKRFKEVFVDEHGNVAWDKDKTIDSNIQWNNRIDLCKDSLYLSSKKANKFIHSKINKRIALKKSELIHA